jgi:hypothetical protein
MRPGNPINLVFSIVHHKALAAPGMPERNGYPTLAGYAVLVRDVSYGRHTSLVSTDDLKNYLERVITECIDAEFRAYSSLPDINTAELERWFIPDSPAMKEIMNLLTRHHKKGWIISNSLNPSTKRLLSIKVKKIERREATVNTMEYWYLRWFETGSGSYTYVYRETNQQRYILKKNAESWRVFENLRPSPRTSLPHRWKRQKMRLTGNP